MAIFIFNRLAIQVRWENRDVKLFVVCKRNLWFWNSTLAVLK